MLIPLNISNSKKLCKISQDLYLISLQSHNFLRNLPWILWCNKLFFEYQIKINLRYQNQKFSTSQNKNPINSFWCLFPSLKSLVLIPEIFKKKQSCHNSTLEMLHRKKNNAKSGFVQTGSSGIKYSQKIIIFLSTIE